MSDPRPDRAASLTELTLELMRIPSPTGGEEALVAHLLPRLAAWPGFRVVPHGRSVIAAIGSGSPHVVLAGHLDTVPEQGHPRPALEGDQVVGLGSSDMKGGLAVMLALGEAASRDPRSRWWRRWTLVFYDGEEGALSGNALSGLFDLEPDLATADLAVLLEPTSNAVELGCQGSLHARITFRGTAAHSARPWMGRNAIHLALPFLTRVAGLPPRKVILGEAEFREVFNVTLAEGGRARNVLPERFTINANLRFAPDRTVEEAEAYLRTLVPSGVECEIVDAAPAAPPRLEAPLVQKFLRDCPAPVRGKQGWTDVAQFAARGVPALNFGPGLPELAHRRDERVPVENLVRALEVLEGFLDLAPGGASR